MMSLCQRHCLIFGNKPKANMSEEESAVDGLVYELYGLSEEEVRIVEGKA